MAAEVGDIMTFMFTGAQGEVIPENATRFIAHESLKVIPARLFYHHPNIVELICHAGVERIEGYAFYECPRLRRLIIPDVKVVEDDAFWSCEALTYIECDELEILRKLAFSHCISLRSIDFPSAKVVDNCAFCGCIALTDAEFGGNLESIGKAAFLNCRSLERITIPLKDGLITADNIFTGCGSLNSVDLVEGAALRETIAALLLEEWRNEMSGEINSINEILPNAPAGEESLIPMENGMIHYNIDRGGKARAMREWIERVLNKIIHYKAKHRCLLDEVASTLTHALTNDIMRNNVLPFLDLPSNTFDGEEEFEEDSSNISGDTEESYDTSDGAEDDEEGAEDDDNKDEESHYSSFDEGGRLEEEGDDDEGRKRQKLLNDNEY